MKELVNLTQSNASSVDTLSQLSAHNPGQFDQSEGNDFQQRIYNITQPKTPAYVVGELTLKAYNWVSQILPYFVPDISFLGAAAAKIPEPLPLKLPRKEVLRVVGEMLEVLDSKNEQEAEQAKDRFLRQVKKALKEEGPLFEENLGIWLKYSEGTYYLSPKIFLFCEPSKEHNINLISPAYIDYNTNSLGFLVGPDVIDNEVMQSFILLSGNAAYRTRRLFSMHEGKIKNVSSLGVNMFKEDMHDSFEAIRLCNNKLWEVKQKVDECIKKENCDDSQDPDLKALSKNNRECVERSPRMPSVVKTSPFDAFECSTSVQFKKLLRSNSPRSRFLVENSGAFKQILKEGVAEKICPENQERQRKENKQFAELVGKKESNFLDALNKIEPKIQNTKGCI